VRTDGFRRADNVRPVDWLSTTSLWQIGHSPAATDIGSTEISMRRLTWPIGAASIIKISETPRTPKQEAGLPKPVDRKALVDTLRVLINLAWMKREPMARLCLHPERSDAREGR
jgi:hypothetical protein